MNKDTTICFRTSYGVRRALDDLAKGSRRSLSAAIEGLLLEYLSDKPATRTIESERRLYSRKEATLPAFVYESDMRGAQPGTILDISLAGARFSVPTAGKIDMNEKVGERPLGLLFTLPQERAPITVKCKAVRVLDAGDGSSEVGAVFVDSDFQSYQKLQSYLMGEAI